MNEKKKPGCLKIILIVFGVFLALSIIIAIIGSLADDSSEPTTASTTKETTAKTSQGSEELFATAKKQFEEGSYLDASATIEKAIKAENKDEYTKLKTDIAAKIKERKTKLESGFEIKEDKVENITFISPSEGVTKGLVFYPYIGVKDSKKYMLLRVGFQEDTSKALFVFTSIKVRAGDKLEELSFNPLNKSSDVDILGAGMTEIVDINVNKTIQNMLDSQIPSTEEVIVRFEDISNKSTDYTLTKEQKQTIADILEYYNYLD
ncbi:hypothetical protein [Paenibacillus sp. Leaf72]|uniref:hypothetical protein n=1 Tax=Paenibacillus sp. Leaf72 TaxID=1736234 RepID=UPI0006F6BC87|nr:hypothetical protein [Paenibacillus sp. Leaf72]KQO18337.1 hypothetical protein ASF12_06890 [Paenibacillus sp. Leaf72]